MAQHKGKPVIEQQDIEDSTQMNADDVQTQMDVLNSKYLRALADYQNLEKRVRVSIEQARIRERESVVRRFIDILDVLERAEVFVSDDGLQVVLKQFRQAINELGIEEMQLVGTEYDPLFAEAIEIVPGEQDNIVVEIVKKGYMCGEDIIRPAQVKVSKVELLVN